MHEHRRSDMNGIIKRLAVLGVSAAFSASLAACTEEDIPQLSISKNITLDFDDSFDFGVDACKGLKLCSLIPGKCIITSADIDEPEISFDFSFNGLSRGQINKFYSRTKKRRFQQYNCGRVYNSAGVFRLFRHHR